MDIFKGGRKVSIKLLRSAVLWTIHSVLEGLLNENNSSRYGVHVFPIKKPRGKGVHNQSNQRSKDFEEIAIFVG
jgi:hypothetical protein